jgi:hypothetical protein
MTFSLTFKVCDKFVLSLAMVSSFTISSFAYLGL